MTRVTLPQKQACFILALLFSSFFSFQIIHSLSFLQNTVTPEVYLGRVAVSLACFFVPIIIGWYSLRLLGGVVFTVFSIVMTLFAVSVSKSTVFMWFVVEYLLLCVVIYRTEEYYESELTLHSVDHEKVDNEINDLETSYKVRGEGISIFFEKYSTYYHLRKLAEELVSSLSVSKLVEIIVNRCAEFIPHGDVILISLADAEERNLSVLASKSLQEGYVLQNRKGDMFDTWVIRNRKRVIINDTHQDFRFDVTTAVRDLQVRSLINVPLLHAGRVIGTLRMNADAPNVFTNDHLRLLDAIGTVASSAISNAMLYEKTEELAIRDSLTGLYVRRYFFERMKQEHRRFLITQRPISLLMCDLDYFKDCNDRYGHAAGDLMLMSLAEILRDSAEDGIVARYGGEEFAVLLVEKDKGKAAEIAEAIRKNVEEAPFQIRREKVQMTLSIGVASLPTDTLDIEMLVQKADEALYEAKRSGRNKVCLSAS